MVNVLTAATAAKLRRLGTRAKKTTAERNNAIREAHAEGGSLREIGDAVDMSHVAVMKILRRVD